MQLLKKFGCSFRPLLQRPSIPKIKNVSIRACVHWGPIKEDRELKCMDVILLNAKQVIYFKDPFIWFYFPGHGIK